MDAPTEIAAACANAAFFAARENGKQ
jgi:hypothetical protein